MLALGVLFPVIWLAQGRLEDYQRSFEWRERVRAAGIAYAEPAAAIPKSNRFWYRKGGEYFAVDATTGAKTRVFDPARLAASLSRVAGLAVNAADLPFTTIEFTNNGGFIEFVSTLRGESRWRMNLDTYQISNVVLRAGDSRIARSLPGPRVPELDRPVASPDGKTEVFLRNWNIWQRTPGKEQAKPLSFDGTEGNYYTLSLAAWSPDSKKLAVYRVRPGQRRKIQYVESSPADQVQPRYITTEYAKPGDALDIPQPVLFDLASGGRMMQVDNSLFPNPYSLTRLEWRKDSRAFTFEYNQRGHQAYRVIEVNGADAKVRAIVDEQSPTFFCYYSKRFVSHVDDGRELVWMSERDGWNHLYLYDGATGAMKNQITKGSWVVRSVAKVDDAKRQIWFSASGMHAGADPYYRHWFRINFDGTGMTPITRLPDANHDLAFSDNMAYFIDTYSTPATAPVVELRKTDDLSLIATLEKDDVAPLVSKLGWRAPETFHAKGRDGSTDIWGLIFRPSRFDATRRYPVLEYIYAGPHDSFVPKTFAGTHPMQAMAELGFIVVQVDGMGTSNRPKAFHDVAWKNIADAGFADRIAWHRAVAAKLGPVYDLARLGIYGHSAGGQNSLGALLFHPEFYKAAASSAGCHDNRMDKISWNEQWMGWPVGPEYTASSNVEHAAKLRGKLLLAVGELDTNVDPASTMQVVNALIQAGKMFDLLVLPGKNHGGWGTYYDRKRADFFVRELLGVTPPDWNTGS